jgi:nucleoid-associated protein YgaU
MPKKTSLAHGRLQVKVAIGLMSVAMLGMVGCQTQSNSKPSADASTMDLTAPAGPVSGEAYAPPVDNPSPDVTATPSTPAMSALPASGNTYQIKPGDTLWKIAASHYGDGKKWKEIVDANPGLDPTKLRIGQTITLP